jgi:hypothetical protein
MLASIGSYVAILCLTAGAIGCAVAPSTPERAHSSTVTANRGDLQCQMERPTGSLLDVQVCTNKAQRDAIKANTQAVQQDLGQTKAGACRGPACSQ